MKYQENLSQKAHEIIHRHRRYRNVDIIKGLGISKASFYNWTNPKHRDYKKDFDENIQQSKAELLDFLEQEMMKQITGYKYEEMTKYYNEKGNLYRVITKKKWQKGDSRLLIFALKSLNPEKYNLSLYVKKLQYQSLIKN